MIEYKRTDYDGDINGRPPPWHQITKPLEIYKSDFRDYSFRVFGKVYTKLCPEFEEEVKKANIWMSLYGIEQ